HRRRRDPRARARERRPAPPARRGGAGRRGDRAAHPRAAGAARRRPGRPARADLLRRALGRGQPPRAARVPAPLRPPRRRLPDRHAMSSASASWTPAERARRDPEGLALDDGTRRRTWAALDDRVRRWARLLREDLGLAPGDHAAVLVGNRVEGVEAVLA